MNTHPLLAPVLLAHPKPTTAGQVLSDTAHHFMANTSAMEILFDIGVLFVAAMVIAHFWHRIFS